jgi:hypothetical protein
VHQLDASDRDRRITELLEAKHHSDTLFDAPVVLLNQVIQVFRRALLRVYRQHAIDLQLAYRAVGRSVAIQCDRLWRSLVILDCFADEGLGSGDVTPAAQSEVDCPLHPINGTV